MGVTVSGAAAEVFWSYYQAAVLGPWTLEGQHLRADISFAYPGRLDKAPLTFVAGGLSRPLDEVIVTGSTLTARMGPPSSGR